MVRKRRALFEFAMVLVAFNLMAPPRLTRAEDHGESASLKVRADSAFLAGDMKGALALYRESYAQSRDTRVLYNAARAASALGDHALAYGYFRTFNELASEELLAKVPMISALIQNEIAQATWLELLADIDGAVVSVRGEKLGATPLSRVLVNSGEARIEVTRDGYAPFNKTLTLPVGGTALVEARLLARATIGVLRIATVPSGARIDVDGEDRGVSPTETLVASGDHKITVRREGYLTQTVVHRYAGLARSSASSARLAAQSGTGVSAEPISFGSLPMSAPVPGPLAG